jgi:hypothetical protein
MKKSDIEKIIRASYKEVLQEIKADNQELNLRQRIRNAISYDASSNMNEKLLREGKGYLIAEDIKAWAWAVIVCCFNKTNGPGGMVPAACCEHVEGADGPEDGKVAQDPPTGTLGSLDGLDLDMDKVSSSSDDSEKDNIKENKQLNEGLVHCCWTWSDPSNPCCKKLMEKMADKCCNADPVCDPACDGKIVRPNDPTEPSRDKKN